MFQVYTDYFNRLTELACAIPTRHSIDFQPLVTLTFGAYLPRFPSEILEQPVYTPVFPIDAGDSRHLIKYGPPLIQLVEAVGIKANDPSRAITLTTTYLYQQMISQKHSLLDVYLSAAGRRHLCTNPHVFPSDLARELTVTTLTCNPYVDVPGVTVRVILRYDNRYFKVPYLAHTTFTTAPPSVFAVSPDPSLLPPSTSMITVTGEGLKPSAAFNMELYIAAEGK